MFRIKCEPTSLFLEFSDYGRAGGDHLDLDRAINGYAVAQWRFRGANVIFTDSIWRFIPFQVVLLPMARLLGLMGWRDLSSLVMVHVIYGMTSPLLPYYVTIPIELVKAAKVDGASFFKFFLNLSALVPADNCCHGDWQFTQIWNDFLFGVSFSAAGTQPVTVALNNIVNSTTGVKEYNVDMASAIIAALPTLAVYVIAGKYFIRGLTAGSVKG